MLGMLSCVCVRAHQGIHTPHKDDRPSLRMRGRSKRISTPVYSYVKWKSWDRGISAHDLCD